jgi:hypothetical protein
MEATSKICSLPYSQRLVLYSSINISIFSNFITIYFSHPALYYFFIFNEYYIEL